MLNKPNTYSFTLTIPPKKKVYYAGKRRAYGTMNHQAQSKFLNDHLIKVIWSQHFDFIDWVFEEHEPTSLLKGLHIHGLVIVNPEFLNLCPVNKLVYDFYNERQVIGIKSLKVINTLSNVQKTIHDITYWEQYMMKNQDKIKFYSPYRSQELIVKQLENGIVNIQYNYSCLDTHPKEWYDYIQNDLGNSPKINKDYLFEKKKNKFIVEL